MSGSGTRAGVLGKSLSSGEGKDEDSESTTGTKAGRTRTGDQVGKKVD